MEYDLIRYTTEEAVVNRKFTTAAELFFERILRGQSPARTLISIKFFSAVWARRHITDAELASSLLPDKIPTKKTPITKPEYW